MVDLLRLLAVMLIGEREGWDAVGAEAKTCNSTDSSD